MGVYSGRDKERPKSMQYANRGALNGVPGKGGQERAREGEYGGLIAVWRIGMLTGLVDVVVVEDLGVPGEVSRVAAAGARERPYIMIFQVSTGRSASLKDQSNFSSDTGSSVGSW